MELGSRDKRIGSKMGLCCRGNEKGVYTGLWGKDRRLGLENMRLVGWRMKKN